MTPSETPADISADHLIDEFAAGRLSRRRLIAQLMAMGAAAAGLADRPGMAAQHDSGDSSTFSAQSIDHVALSVTDIPRSRDWYVRHLGLRVMRQSESSCFLDCGDDFLALFKSDKPGLHHYSFAIPEYDQDDAARRLREAGLTPKPRGRRMYFDDPDGIEVQVSPM